MDIHVASIVNNLSLYTIGKENVGEVPSQVIRRGHKKIATYRMNPDAKTALLFGYNATLLKRAKKGFYFPAIQLKNQETALNQMHFQSQLSETFDSSIVIRNKRDFALLAEQIRIIKVLHKGNLSKVIEDIKSGNFDSNSGHLEYITLIEETPDSNLAIKLMVDKGAINIALFAALFKNHALDVSNIFPSTQILKRLISQIDDPKLIHELYINGVETYQNSLRGEESKISALAASVLENEFTSQEVIERIALSPDIHHDCKVKALSKLRTFNEYSDYPDVWMKKLFDVK